MDMCRVFVGNLPYEVDATGLRVMMQSAGTIRDVNVPIDASGSRPHRRFGYVSYADEASAARAVASMNGKMIFNQSLSVAIATPPPSGPRGPSAGPGGHSTGPHVGHAGGASHLSNLLNTGSLAASNGAMHSAPTTALLAPSVRSAIESMTPLEMWTTAHDMKSLADTDIEQAKALLQQYPMLAHALHMIEEKLGLMKQQQLAIQLAQQQQLQQLQLMQQQQMQQQMLQMQQQQQQHAQWPQAGGAAQLGAPNAAPAAMAGTSTMAAQPADAAAVPSSSDIDDEQVALLRGILAMSEADLAQLPEDQQVGVKQVRDAVNLPLAQIQALPAAQRDEMLQLREQLHATLGTQAQ